MLILIHAPDMSLHRELCVNTRDESINNSAAVTWLNARNSKWSHVDWKNKARVVYLGLFYVRGLRDSNWGNK